MYGKLTYAPHQLYLAKQEKRFDAFGNFEGTAETLEFVCNCRCDDAGVADAVTINGEQFFPSYHIVCEKGVENGAFVRVLSNSGVRAEGKVVKTSHANYFDLYEAWI